MLLSRTERLAHPFSSNREEQVNRGGRRTGGDDKILPPKSSEIQKNNKVVGRTGAAKHTSQHQNTLNTIYLIKCLIQEDVKNKVINNVKNCGKMALYFLSLVTRNAGGFFKMCYYIILISGPNVNYQIIKTEPSKTTRLRIFIFEKSQHGLIQ